METEAGGSKYQTMGSPRGDLRRRRRVTRQAAPKIGDLHVWTLKERLQTFLDGSAGVAIEGTNVFLSVLLVTVAIIDTYSGTGVGDNSDTYVTFEIVCTIFFAADYFLHIYAAQNQLAYLVTAVGIVDFFTIVPTVLALSLKWFKMNGVLPLLRIARIFRILAALRLYRVMVSRHGFEYQLSIVVFLLFSLILIAAGVFQILEQSYYTDQDLDPLQFHQAMYFVFVTISTVGYGDITPHTTEGQLFVMFVIIVVITVVPTQVARLMELSAQQHDYMHSYTIHQHNIHNGGHVVVTGHVRLRNAAAFLREFYRARQGRVNMDVVFLADRTPSPALQALLLNVRYRRRTTYLKGSLLHDKDAKRACVADAAAVFIFADKSATSPAESVDALSILQALVVDKFRSRIREGGDDEELDEEAQANSHDLNVLHSRPVRCFMEIMSPKHTRSLRTVTGADMALNTALLRRAILARSTVCPGATALLLNLIYSPTERYVAQGRRSCVPWIVEYAGGLQNLLFPVVLPTYFDGLLFERAAEKLYLIFKVMMIALYDRSAGDTRIRLCPFGERLEERALVFVIAPSSSIAKHAIDALEQHVQKSDFEDYASFDVSSSYQVPYDALSMNAPQTEDSERPDCVLVFSSETVLDRQSFQGDLIPEVGIQHSPRSTGTSTTPSASTDTSPVLKTTWQSPLKLSPDSSPTQDKTLHNYLLICGSFAQGIELANHLNDLYMRESLSDAPCIVLLVKKIPRDQDLSALQRALAVTLRIEVGDSQNVEDLIRVKAHEASSVLLLHNSCDCGDIEDEGRFRTVSKYLEDYQVIMSTLALRTAQSFHREYVQLQQQADANHFSARAAFLALERAPTMSSSVVTAHDSIKFLAYKLRGEEFLPDDGQDDDNDSIAGISDVPRNEYENERIHDRPARRNPLGFLKQSCTKGSLQRNVSTDYMSSPCFNPAYAAGEVFVDSVLDTLLCQSFFNPYSVDLIRALVGDYSTPTGDHIAFKASMMRLFSASEEASRLEEKSPPRQSTSRHCRHPVLRVASVSRELEGAPFAEVFARALRQQIFVVGVYRRAQARDRGNSLPYVVTCPESPLSCYVERGDLLHVITKRPPPVCVQW